MSKKIVRKVGISQTLLYRYCKHEIEMGNDLQIIIRAFNSRRGVGKTTLAIALCRMLDSDWTSKRAVIDLEDYLRIYNLPDMRGGTVLFDEIEASNDNRRSMSGDNITLSRAWSMLRYRQINTVVTLPNDNVLDKRLLDLADLDILVMNRGTAFVFAKRTHIFKGYIWKELMGQNKGCLEKIKWTNLDNDTDFKELEQMKDDYTSAWITDELYKMEKAAKKAGGA